MKFLFNNENDKFFQRINDKGETDEYKDKVSEWTISSHN